MPPLLSVFSTLEGFTSDLYPYRYVVTPVLLALTLAAIVVAARANVPDLLWRHRLATAVIGGPLLVLSVIAGDYLLSPLWERSFLDEPSPVLAAADTPTNPGAGQDASQAAAAAPVSGGARVLARGVFRGADEFHFGRGSAQLIRTEAGGHMLRFEDFSVRNGPDLYVYLVRDEGGRRVEEALNLGRLRATDGAFNYDIPAHIDLGSVRGVVVWCRQFTTLFAHAPLTAG